MKKKKFKLKSGIKKLQLDKKIISKFDAKKVKGGQTGASNCRFACTM